MEFTKFAPNAFKEIVFGAGFLCEDFDPDTGVVSNILGSLDDSGFSFSDEWTTVDLGENIAGCPRGTKELTLEDTDERNPHGSGTFVTVSAERIAQLVGGADSVTTSGVTKITPRELAQTDFLDEVWFVSNYGEYHIGTATAGCIAIKMMNVLNVGGFSFTTTNKDKGTFAFDYKAHRSISTPNEIPYEIYVKNGSAPTP